MWRPRTMCRSDALIGLSTTRTSASPGAKGGVGISASCNTLFGSPFSRKINAFINTSWIYGLYRIDTLFRSTRLLCKRSGQRHRDDDNKQECLVHSRPLPPCIVPQAAERIAFYPQTLEAIKSRNNLSRIDGGIKR